ncbi:MAG: type II secretion system F family protein [Candidatus Liptonbacteria bacterium]|nr:type II secretion system F family protein [Candidatus Liptonbacteria bacterium]
MLYHYIASDSSGKMEEGDMDADSLQGILRSLATKGLKPISVQAQGDAKKGFNLFSGKINLSDRIFLTKYLALMLKVGTDLLSAVNILIADFEKPVMKNLLLEIRDNLTKGQPFNQVFAKHPKYFSPVFINMVKAAEASGNLEKTFEDLSISLQRDGELQGRIKAAMIYPLIILVASVGIFLFLTIFALPKISEVFAQGDLKPPTFSRIVFGIGDFVNDNLLVLAISIIFTAVSNWIFFRKTAVGKLAWARLMNWLPIVKNLYRDIAVQRFASTLSSLMKAGLPIIQAINITADVVGSYQFKKALNRIAEEGLAKGLTVGNAFKREAVFPGVVTNLIAISEKSGHLAELLDTLAEFYATRIDSNVKVMISILEPALLLVMGLMVGSIALAIIIPIYQLTSNF